MHTITVTGVSGIGYVTGIMCRNLSVATVDIMNGGYGGSNVTVWNGGFAWGPANASRKTAPKLTIIGHGTNESSVSVLRAGLITMVRKARETGDALLVCPGPTGTVGSWNSIQSDVHDMYLELSDTLSCGLIDFYALNVSYAAMVAAGKMFDNLHENLAGYTPEWQSVADALSAV